ncbi:MAG: CBS domain-containing protein, partial [Nitrosopumilus sp.]
KLLVKDALNVIYPKVTSTATINDIIKSASNSDSKTIFVVSPNRTFLGILELDDVLKFQNDSNFIISSLLKKSPTVTIDQSLYDALKIISNLKNELLPVINSENIVLGTVSVSDIIRVYDLELETLQEDKDERLSGSID